MAMLLRLIKINAFRPLGLVCSPASGLPPELYTTLNQQEDEDNA